jgi:predicted DNA-binding transcriptional regulator AlpA
MATKDDFTFEELDRLSLMTITQAQVYVEYRIGMKSSTFYDCIRPLLKPKPRAINFRKKRRSWLTVKKEEVDQVIEKMMEK